MVLYRIFAVQNNKTTPPESQNGEPETVTKPQGIKFRNNAWIKITIRPKMGKFG